MKNSLILVLAILAALLLVPAPARPIDGVPLMKTATPATVQAGEEVTVIGEFLDAGRVVKVMLTDGKADFDVKVLRQNGTEIRVRLPKDLAPARYTFLVQTPGEDGMLIEQPLRITVVTERKT